MGFTKQPGRNEETNGKNCILRLIKKNPNVIIDGIHRVAKDVILMGTKGKKNDFIIKFEDGFEWGISFKMYKPYSIENWVNYDKFVETQCGDKERAEKILQEMVDKQTNKSNHTKNPHLGFHLNIVDYETEYPLPDDYDIKDIYFNENTYSLYKQNKNKTFPYEILQDIFDSPNMKYKKNFNIDKKEKLYYFLRPALIMTGSNIAKKIICYYHPIKDNLIINNQNDIKNNFILTPIFCNSNLRIILINLIKNRNIKFNFLEETYITKYFKKYRVKSFTLPPLLCC